MDFGIRSMLLAVRSMAKTLASVPGRKTMILFSSGFPLTPEYTSELTAAINACNRANVAVYPVDVRGLVSNTEALPPQTYLRPVHRFGPFATSFADPGQVRGGGSSGGGQTPGGSGSSGSGSSGGTGGKSGSGSTGGGSRAGQVAAVPRVGKVAAVPGREGRFWEHGRQHGLRFRKHLHGEWQQYDCDSVNGQPARHL